MTKKEAIRQNEQENRLLELGFTRDEAEQLRRISMTLHRWYELKCGDSNTFGSWAIERDNNGDGPPFLVHHHYLHGRGKDYTTRTKIADRERGAVKRLQAIIDARNTRNLKPCGVRCLYTDETYRADRVTHDPDCPNAGMLPISYYLQTDPRGAVLYIIRPGDVPEGKDVASYYNRGICVY